jgi:hypothetical protein
MQTADLRAVLSHRARSDESGLVGDDDELRAIVRVEFGHRPGDVCLTGGWADDEVLGDLVVGQPGGNQREDLTLPVGEGREAARRRGGEVWLGQISTV